MSGHSIELFADDTSNHANLPYSSLTQRTAVLSQTRNRGSNQAAQGFSLY